MKIEQTQVFGFVPTLRGMRNPLNSWSKSDSIHTVNFNYEDYMIEDLTIGKNDLKLAQNLIKAGNEHSKFLRMIQVWVDLTLPRYIWSEFDTYRYNTKNSCSTMHKLFDKLHVLSIEDFEYVEYNGQNFSAVETNAISNVIERLNTLRNQYFISTSQQEKDNILTSAKRILPESYLQKRTMNTNYAELRNIYFQRRYHRLSIWKDDICGWIKSLPYAKELITLE